MSEPLLSRRRKKIPEELIETTIEKLSSDGRGLAHVNDRVVFINNALEGEKVIFKYTRLTKKIAEGRTVEVLEPSQDRVTPVCDVTHICGGCSLQHMKTSTQIAIKEKGLLDQLSRIGGVSPAEIMKPLTGPTTSYRHKARLGVRYVHKKNKVLVGFRERGGSYVTETSRCEILHDSVGVILADLSKCIGQLEAYQRVPQIEVAVGDNQSVLIIRALDKLSEQDNLILKLFAQKHQLVIYIQYGASDCLTALWPEVPASLYYELHDEKIRIEFEPADFTQVNPAMNIQMVNTVIQHLQLEETDHVLELFCGLGNFSLPVAKYCKKITSVEGVISLIKKARRNAELNSVENVEFIHGDLYADDIRCSQWITKKYNKILLDPPRSGANNILNSLAKMDATRIVYISCHTATLARDAGILVNELGYTLTHTGVMDMFPHTTHIESIAVFAR